MIKKVIIVVVILVSLVVAYNLISQIINASKSGERLSEAAEVVYNLEAENKQLKKKLEEIQSPQFIEEEARNKLNLGKSGETIVIIPDEKIKQVLGSSNSAQIIRLPNYLGWFRVFFK